MPICLSLCGSEMTKGGIAFYVHFRRKHDAMTPYNLFSLLVERLMLNTDKLTMATYNVLFEVNYCKRQLSINRLNLASNVFTV